MQYDFDFIMQKKVNWSLLNQGLSIPIAACTLFEAWNPSILIHGNSIKIKILIDSELYDATLVNQNFNKQVYPTHKDIIQIRYTENMPIASKLRSCFAESFRYLSAQRQMPENRRKQIALPDNINESVRLYFTDNPNVMCMECYTCNDYNELAETLATIPEEVYETVDDEKFFIADKSASIEVKEKLVKYRKLDKSIIDKLKKHYDYRDQITGEKIGDKYGDSVVEAHHIDFFTQSQNNDTTNIIILSPNYHRIIHRNNPIFNRRKFEFEFSNGEVLRLKLYDHLLV